MRVACGRTSAEVLARDPTLSARVLYARALEAMFAGDPETYLSLCEAARAAFERGGDLRNETAQRGILGFAHLELGANEEAARVLRETLDAADRMGLPTVVLHARHNLGLALARLGALSEARRIEEEAIADALAQSDLRMEGGSRVYLATILAQATDLPAAEREARQACAVLAGVPSLLPFGAGDVRPHPAPVRRRRQPPGGRPRRDPPGDVAARDLGRRGGRVARPPRPRRGPRHERRPRRRPRGDRRGPRPHPRPLREEEIVRSLDEYFSGQSRSERDEEAALLAAFRRLRRGIDLDRLGAVGAPRRRR